MVKGRWDGMFVTYRLILTIKAFSCAAVCIVSWG